MKRVGGLQPVRSAALVAAACALALPAGAGAATVTVTNTADAGAGSLREAITSANALGGADEIAFSIGSGAATISPSSALPAISDPLTIDATTQPGFAGAPLIRLSGASAGAGANGLTVGAGGAGSVIRGLVIGDFATAAGIAVGAAETEIAGNWIGVDTAGAARPNGAGVTVLTGATATVGGDTASDRNVIAGNLSEGVSLNADSASATILGNHIGITPTGTLSNGVGVLVNGVAASALVGAPGARNVISGNTTGILVASTSTATIDNNYVGLGPDGATLAGNLGTGISIGGGAIVAIGGPSGNTISDNLVGVQLDGKITAFANNQIGTDATGALARGNHLAGVQLLSTGTTIGGDSAASRNIISANGAGVHASKGIGIQVMPSADDTTISGNYIGVSVSGVAALGNTSRGIAVEAGATGVTIGGVLSGGEQATPPCDGPCNVVSATSGTGDVGVSVAATATGAKIQGNSIGTRADGSISASNAFVNTTGIAVAAADATIGGVAPDGVSPSARNVIAGKVTSALPNTTVGIDASGANLAIAGNHIGVLADGVTPASLATGVKISGSATNRRLGDTLSAAALATPTCDGACNLVSANVVDDVSISGGAVAVRGNRIGTNASGTASLAGPVSDGIQAGANQVIGGATPGDRNLISGHAGGAGIRVNGNDVVIQGNDIGTAAGGNSGTPALRNDSGISVDGGLNNVSIGGEVAPASVGGVCDGVCNVLSNNFSAGVITTGAASPLIAGNHIGVTRSGDAVLGNTIVGVSHRSAAAVTVGGTTAGRRNVISGNDGSGVETSSAGTGALTVQGNYLGVAANGTAPAPNGGAGIHVATRASIGGTGAASNRIAQNIGDGVFVAPEATGATTVLENEIFANGQLGIDLGVADEPAPGVTANDPGDGDAGGNGLQNFPELTGATRGFADSVQVRGALDSGPGSHVLRIYANDACDLSGNGEAARFVGSGTVSASASASFSVAVPVTGVAPAPGTFLTATVTNATGHTSELSPCVTVRNGVRLSSASYAVSETGGTASITVERAVDLGTEAVRVDTVAGGSASAGDDYTPGQHVVQFDPGQTARAALIPILDDAALEEPETVNLALTNPSAGLDRGAPPFRDSAVLTITSDELAPVQQSGPASAPAAGGGAAAAPAGGSAATPGPVNPPAVNPPAVNPAAHEPDSALDRLALTIAASALRRLSGTASDPDGDLARVDVALVSVAGKARTKRLARTCLHYGRAGAVTRRRAASGQRCTPRTWLRATGTTRWRLPLARRLPRGVWTIYVRAMDAGGRRETSFTAGDGNLAVVRIKRG